MPNGYSRPRKTSLCHHPGPEIHPEPISIFRPPQNLALWLFVSSDPRHPHGAPPPGRAPFSCLWVCPRACMRLFVSPGSRSPSRGHIRSAHSSVRSGMCSPLRASLSQSATTVSPGGRRIQAREHFSIGGNKKNCHIPPTHFFCVGGFSRFKQFLPSHPRFFHRRVS